MDLRPYQKQAVNALWAWFRTNPEGAPLLVLPTGTGKSLVIADIAKKVAEKGKRVLVLIDSQELVSQNFEKLAALYPFGSIGKYSAGLKTRDTTSQVIVAGIQSVHQKADELGPFALCIIDEAHTIPPDGEGMYRSFIDDMVRLNPEVRFAGTTATPYRLGSGMLTQDSGIFTNIAYELPMRDAIAQGYLCPLVSKAGKVKPDVSKIAVRGGEFVAGDMERAFNRLDLVEAALEEVVAYGQDRKSWLIFAAGVTHAEKVCEVLQRVGIPTGVVTGNTPPLFRSQIIGDFKAGRLRALVGCDIFKKGFDHPPVDLIAILRATKSTSLFVQMCGRGTRIADGKTDCLILDYGRNIEFHGPVDRVQIVKRWSPEKGEVVDAIETVPCRECPDCRSLVPLASQECPDCGYAFLDVMRLNHQATASSAPILSEPEPMFDVDVYKTAYDKHQKADKPLPTLRVDYSIAILDGVPVKKVSEWVCLEHPGFAGNKAVKWWAEHTSCLANDIPKTVDEAMGRTSELRTPKKLRIQRDGKFWRVVKVLEWMGEAEQQEQAAEEAETEKYFETKGVNI